MKIILIGARKISPTPKAGLDHYVKNLADSLIQEGHEVSVYSHETIWTVKRHHWDTLVYALLATLKSLFQKGVVIHYHGGAALFAWIPRLLGKKVFVTIHSREKLYTHTSWYWRPFYFLGEWMGIKAADKVYAVSKTLAEALEKEYHKKVELAPIQVKSEPPGESNLLKQWGLKPKGYLLFLGRVEKGKGIEFLLRAYRSLGEEIPYPLVIAGEPLYDKKYFGALKKSAPKNILFTGHISGSLKQALLTHALLYVQASGAEGLSISLLEAVRCGLPTLVTDIPENREAAGNAGLFFKPDDMGDFQNQLKKILRTHANFHPR